MAGYARTEVPDDVNVPSCLRQLQYLMPIYIQPEYDIVDNGEVRVMLDIVDVINGFCRAGCGALAPSTTASGIEQMINRIDRLASRFSFTGRRVVFHKDCHDGPEPPYPNHAMRGTVEADIVNQLAWLNQGASLIIEKSCINGWIGAERAGRINILMDFINKNKINVIVVAGICTDLCVKELVLSLLSARNARLLPTLRDVVVYTEACTTYDLPVEVCHQQGLPETLAHPIDLLQYIGLHEMQRAGAILTNNILI